MVECTREECILLHLSSDGDQTGSPPQRASIRDICEALDVGAETMADRIAVLSSLSDLTDGDLVEKRTTTFEERSGEHPVYELTSEGRARAAEVRDRLHGQRIVVETDGGRSEVDIEEADRYFDDSPLAHAASRLRDGVLRFRDGGGEGIVDRETDLARLERVVEEVESGSPQAVLVRGQAGIGKTTLVEEMTDHARDQGFDVLWGASRRGTEEAYGPLKSALAEASADVEDPFVRADTPADDEEEYEAGRSSLFHDVVTVVETLAAENPIVVVVDDVHRAADPTLELIEHVTHHVEGRVLVVGTHRFEDLPSDHPLSDPETAGWPDPDRTTWIHLDPLGRDDTRTLIERLVGRVDVPDQFLDRVYEETGGSPLFIEETVNRLLDDGRLDDTHGVYPTEGTSLPIPDRVESVVEDRLSVLDETGIDVLERAAVVGEEVPFSLLADITDRSEPTVREYVDVLEGSRVLQWEDSDRLRFVSAVIRKTVLEEIDDDRRRRIHERVADAYLSATDDPADQYVTVADHFERAGETENALEYYRRGAERARGVYAHELAMENYESALALARKLGREEVALETIESIAEIHHLSGNHEEAERHFQYVRDRTDDVSDHLRIAYHLTNMHRTRGETDRGIEAADSALDGWSGDPDPDACRLLGEKGRCLRNDGDLDGAEKLFDRQTRIATELDDDALLGHAYHNRGLVALDRGQEEEAVEMYESAIEHLERSNERRRLAKAHNNLGIAYNRNGDTDRATEEQEVCLELQLEIGDVAGAAVTRMNLGSMHSQRGALKKAQSLYETAIATDRKIGQYSNLAFSQGNLANLHVQTGDMDRAKEYFESSLKHYEDIGASRYQAFFTIQYANFLVLRAEFEAATEHAERGLDIASQASAINEEAEALDALGYIYREQGDIEEALDTHQRFYEQCEDIGSLEKRLQGSKSLGYTYLEADEPENAMEHAKQAREYARDVAVVWQTIDTRLLVAMCNREIGQYDRAERELRDLVAEAGELGSVSTECEALIELGKLYEQRGDHGAATETARKALDVAEESGYVLYERDADRLLDGIEAGS